jgi:hypothetical protein
VITLLHASGNVQVFPWSHTPEEHFGRPTVPKHEERNQEGAVVKQCLPNGASTDCVERVVEICWQKYCMWVCGESCLEGLANDGWTTLDGISMLEWSEGDACIFDHGEGTATGYAVQRLSDGNAPNPSWGLAKISAKCNAIAIKQIFQDLCNDLLQTIEFVSIALMRLRLQVRNLQSRFSHTHATALHVADRKRFEHLHSVISDSADENLHAIDFIHENHKIELDIMTCNLSLNCL